MSTTSVRRRKPGLHPRLAMSCFRFVFLFLVLGVAALAAACDKTEQTLGAFATQREGWDRRVSAMRNRTNDLEARFKSLPPLKADSPVAAQMQRRRLEASIIGTRQTLADIQSHASDSAREIETASRQDNEEGETALSGVIARVNEFVRQQEQALAVNEEAVIRMGGATQP